VIPEAASKKTTQTGRKVRSWKKYRGKWLFYHVLSVWALLSIVYKTENWSIWGWSVLSPENTPNHRIKLSWWPSSIYHDMVSWWESEIVLVNGKVM
jgi:hypothetical protein